MDFILGEFELNLHDSEVGCDWPKSSDDMSLSDHWLFDFGP